MNVEHKEIFLNYKRYEGEPDFTAEQASFWASQFAELMNQCGIIKLLVDATGEHVCVNTADANGKQVDESKQNELAQGLQRLMGQHKLEGLELDLTSNVKADNS